MNDIGLNYIFLHGEYVRINTLSRAMAPRDADLQDNLIPQTAKQNFCLQVHVRPGSEMILNSIRKLQSGLSEDAINNSNSFGQRKK